MKGFKSVKIEDSTIAIFFFDTFTMYCDYEASWDERSWTEEWDDPRCYPEFSSKELIDFEITKFYIEGNEISFYKEKHKKLEELLELELIKEEFC